MPETTRTPSGNYPKPASVHSIDVEATADRLIAELPGRSRRTESLARESGVSLLMMAMEGGDSLNEHSAKGVVTIHLLRGHVTVASGETAVDLRPGQLVLMQPQVSHDLRAEEQSVVLLTIGGGDD